MTTALDIPLLDRIEKPARWLVTGGAGFIGSHLVETLLAAGQEVVCLDNFSTGTRDNLEAAVSHAGSESRERLTVIEGDITDRSTCRQATDGVDHLLHQAALASVPASLENPRQFHEVNVGGTLNLFDAARASGVTRVVYASSSAVYGDDPREVKVEESIGTPLSPYAATKTVMETWAATYASCYAMEFVGLRYFNVYGSRQDPSGPYAAVIPIWESAMKNGAPVRIFGDGRTTRDFVHVSDVVRVNLTAALAPLPEGSPALALNVGTGTETSLLELFEAMRSTLLEQDETSAIGAPVFEAFREGDIPRSVADLTRLGKILRISPRTGLAEGMRKLLV